MKALTIHQPWAELILQGRKTIELRERITGHRGLLAIRAGMQVETAACSKHGLDPAELPKGGLVGTVEVVEMIRFDGDLWSRLRDQHLSQSRSPGNWRGWRLQNPRRLAEPVACRPLPGLFEIRPEIAERMRWMDGGKVTQ